MNQHKNEEIFWVLSCLNDIYYADFDGFKVQNSTLLLQNIVVSRYSYFLRYFKQQKILLRDLGLFFKAFITGIQRNKIFIILEHKSAISEYQNTSYITNNFQR